eukprot:2278296-Karenia_brevis.AAC.1
MAQENESGERHHCRILRDHVEATKSSGDDGWSCRRYLGQELKLPAGVRKMYDFERAHVRRVHQRDLIYIYIYIHSPAGLGPNPAQHESVEYELMMMMMILMMMTMMM